MLQWRGNALAYSTAALITVVKSFIVDALLGGVVNKNSVTRFSFIFSRLGGIQSGKVFTKILAKILRPILSKNALTAIKIT